MLHRSERILDNIPVGSLGIIAVDGCEEMGNKVNDYLVKWRKEETRFQKDNLVFNGYEKPNYLINAKVPRFGSGEAKGIINESVRGKDLYLMVDVCNYSLTYSLSGNTNHMSPDDHFQNLKRVIAAVGGKARRLNVIMPFLYESRQHKRTKRESLDCALALQELIARESNPSHACVLTIGQFAAGSAPNIIPEIAVLQGTIRTNDKGARELLVRRMKQVAEGEAAVFGASVEIEMLSEVCPLICDPTLTDEMVGYIKELPVPGLSLYPGASANASEDFALIAERVPSVFMYLGSGYLDERGDYGAHNPKVVFDEAVCPIGVAGLVHCAVQWLKKH